MTLRLARIRRSRGMTRRDLALASGLSPSYITELEKGRYSPTARVLCMLKAALDCSLDDLVDC
ncbi:MAG TPA: helix-turn-helix transcriptional regulator [Thermoanaerobacterales bacterium]|nr:helix-turn-helix transcriptional regulator [Thermoanaerobacterales bacterium]